MKIISYSLFGYNKETPANCFSFNSYLRGFLLNVRLARLLYPDWVVRVYTDKETAEHYKELFDKLPIQYVVNDNCELTKAMLWRMKPAFDETVDMFICRDTDSPLTYRERQAVYQWETSTKQAHSITDSISHNIPMLGGMVGFKTLHFKEFTKFNTWDEMVGIMSGYERKGADQDLLNKFIYPIFANSRDSIMMHYFLGMRNPYIDGYMTCNCRQDDKTWHVEDCKLNIEIPNLPKELEESNHFAGHIGAAGWYEPPMFKCFLKHLDKFDDIREAEKSISNELNWNI